MWIDKNRRTGAAGQPRGLVEDGLIGLNRPVQEYVPEFTGVGKEHVTIRHLLTHSSGLHADAVRHHAAGKPRPVTLPDPAENQHASIAERLFLGYDVPLSNPPGVKMDYCDYGYELLGEIVRRVSGRGLSQFATDRIFRPLEMNDTYFVVPESERCRIARRRSATHADVTAYAGQYETREFEETPWASAGAFSTVQDIAVFGEMFLRRGTLGDARVLGPASVAAVTSNQTPGLRMGFDNEHFLQSSWGLGWSVRGSKQPRRGGSLWSAQTFDHPGSGGIYAWVDPACGLLGVYFSLLLTGAPGLNPAWRADLFSNMVMADILDQ